MCSRRAGAGYKGKLNWITGVAVSPECHGCSCQSMSILVVKGMATCRQCLRLEDGHCPLSWGGNWTGSFLICIGRLGSITQCSRLEDGHCSLSWGNV
jgi:hypothetical protein